MRMDNFRKSMKPPMRYPGNKYSSLPEILGHLPYRDKFVDVFGGSAAVLLGRRPHGLEVYNDRFTGLVDFYRCIRNHCDLLCSRLEILLHSREDWEYCKAHWEEPDPNTTEGLVERAARWYYLVQMSYAGIDRCWMRSLGKRNEVISQYRKKIELFPTIHERFKNVQVENLDWFAVMLDYDSPRTVFYLDPPYMNQENTQYKHTVDHNHMLEMIFKMEGFVALSGYPTPEYEKYPWDARHEWQRTSGIKTGQSTEVLWIKN